jgi:hypothetical protein
MGQPGRGEGPRGWAWNHWNGWFLGPVGWVPGEQERAGPFRDLDGNVISEHARPGLVVPNSRDEPAGDPGGGVTVFGASQTPAGALTISATRGITSRRLALSRTFLRFLTQLAVSIQFKSRKF